jgi:hypothetical protein
MPDNESPPAPPDCTAAYPLAGQAVVAWLLSRKIRQVALTAETSGEPRHLHPTTGLELSPLSKKIDIHRARDRFEAEREIQVLLAGPLARSRAEGRRDWDVLTASDLGPAQTLGAIHGGGMRELPHSGYSDRFLDRLRACTDRYLDWLVACTATLLDAHWPLVDLLAAALVERGEIPGRDLDALLREADRRRSGDGVPDSSPSGTREHHPRLLARAADKGLVNAGAPE